jgi:aquaporin Z
VTNTSVNPARSIGPALFAGGGPIGQLWLFIVAPAAGAMVAGLFYAAVLGRNEPHVALEPATGA